MIKLEGINKTYFGAQPLHVLKGIDLYVGVRCFLVIEDHVRIYNNESDYGGGIGTYGDDSFIYIKDSVEIYNNYAMECGGGISVYCDDLTPNLFIIGFK